MTPKEKTKELVDKFIFIDNGEKFQIISIADEKRAIQCALIAVDEVLEVINQLDDSYSYNAGLFFNEVKQEINKL